MIFDTTPKLPLTIYKTEFIKKAEYSSTCKNLPLNHPTQAEGFNGVFMNSGTVTGTASGASLPQKQIVFVPLDRLSPQEYMELSTAGKNKNQIVFIKEKV